MKLYIYDCLPVMSDAYHSGGGAVIITDRNPQDVWYDLGLRDEDGDLVPALPFADLVLTTDATEEKVFLFPDAGCC